MRTPQTKNPPARKSRTASTPLPSRDDILAFIAAHPGKAGKREIARHFGLNGSQRIPLKAMLKDLAANGAVEKKRGKLKRPADLAEVAVLEVDSRDADGELIAVPAERDGAVPRIVVTTGRGKNTPAPGIGDRILARLARDGDGYTARVIRIIEEKPAAVLGVVRHGAAGSRIEPVDRKQKELILARSDVDKAREGDLVAVRVVRTSRFGLDSAHITEVLGNMKSEKAVSMIAIHAHGIPHVFPREAIAEAEAAKAATMADREDWRAEPLLTIDPVDAKDYDDAVMARPDPDPGNPGGVIATVAIADVALYVRPGSALDREALHRGNSVYFPDRVVPMLPERISNDLCSLREGEDRPALAVRMVFAADGRKLSHRFHRIMMRSPARLSYAEAQSAFDGRPSGRAVEAKPILADLWAGYQVLKRGRAAREPLDLELPERKIILGKDGHVDRIIVPESLEANRLIEEFMIQANVAAAETLEAKRTPLLYRIHDAPSMAKLEALRDFLKSIDMNLPKVGNMRPSNFNRILDQARASENESLLHEVVLRSQAQAEYNPANIGHFGLNLRRYAHFTSPIRRYADLIVHRGLIRALGLGAGGLTDDMEARLPQIAEEVSAAERRAMTAERDTVDRLVAHWLADRIGARFPGRISGVTRAGLFVKLDETGADGFVPMRTLGSEYFNYDEARRAVIGSRSGTMYRMGDPVEVKLVEAAPLAGALRFEMLSEGRAGPRGRKDDRAKGRAREERRGQRGKAPKKPAARRR